MHTTCETIMIITSIPEKRPSQRRYTARNSISAF
jgi:hypothetical protein